MNKKFGDIIEAFSSAKIDITETQAEKMDVMTGFLQDYCNKVNLTAIRDREGIIEKHLIDSVLPLTMVKISEGEKCIDIGTGAGFPAVPMMIYREDLKFTLLDSQRKRTDYLTLLLKETKLKAEVIHGRAEELGRNQKYKRKYGMVTARAVADLSTLFKYAAPMLKDNGIFLAMRGSKEELTDELKETAEKSSLHFEYEKLYLLPKGDKRRILLFKKISDAV